MKNRPDKETKGLYSLVMQAVNQSLSLAAAAMVGILMFLIFTGVVGRYVFNKPLFGAYELIEILMGLLIFAGLPIVSKTHSHISVDFLAARFPRSLQPFREILIDILCAVTSAIMSWRIWMYGARLNRFHETTLELKIELGFIAYSIAVILIFVTLAFLTNAWETFSSMRSSNR